MATIAPDLKSKLQHAPNMHVRLILRFKDDATRYVESVEARGLTVRHVYALMNAMAVEGTGSAALTVAEEPWVTLVEEDRPVHTM